ncbi:hypothetical protein E3P91_03089 [Wallemia ichthyophaga]|nr:hypothetical protein E3P91_03089 [Wallemia ichthyophaga]
MVMVVGVSLTTMSDLEISRQEKLARARNHLKKAQSKKKHSSSASRDVSSLFTTTPTDQPNSPLFSPTLDESDKTSDWDALQSSLQIQSDKQLDVDQAADDFDKGDQEGGYDEANAVDGVDVVNLRDAGDVVDTGNTADTFDTLDKAEEPHEKRENAQESPEMQRQQPSLTEISLEELKQQLNEAHIDHSAQMSEKKNTIDALEKTIIELKSNSGNSDEVNNLERKLDSIQAQLMSNKQSHQETNSALQHSENERNQQRENIDAIEQKLSHASEQLLRSKLDNKSVRDEVERGNSEIKSLKEQLSEQLSTISNLQEMEKEKERLSTLSSNLQESNESLSHRLSQLEEENASLKQTIEKDADRKSIESLDKGASTIPLNTNGHFVSAAARSLIPSSVMHKRRESLQMLKIRMDSHIQPTQMDAVNEESLPRNQFMTNDDPLFFCAACENENDEGEGLIVL